MLRLSLYWRSVPLCLALTASAHASTDTPGPSESDPNAPQDYYSTVLSSMNHADISPAALGSLATNRGTRAVSNRSARADQVASSNSWVDRYEETQAQSGKRVSGRSAPPPSVPQLPPTLLAGALPLFGLVVSRLRRR